MEIDLITLVAQIVNLIILVWLLKKFLYKPLLDMVDARQALILKNVNDAKKAAEQAKAEEQKYALKVEAFEAERQELLKQTQEQAEQLKETLSNEAKVTVEETKKRWQNELAQEKKSFDLDMRDRIVQQFKAFADASLKEMADLSLQEQVENQFKNKLSHLSAAEKKSFTAAAQKSKKVLLTYGLPETVKRQKEMKSYLMKTFKLPDSVAIEIKENPDLICGIEIQTVEFVISWSLADYLDKFSINLDATLAGALQTE